MLVDRAPFRNHWELLKSKGALLPQTKTNVYPMRADTYQQRMGLPMTECAHERTVQLLGVISKCTNCGALVEIDDTKTAPDWAEIRRNLDRRQQRIEAYKRQNRGR